MALTPGYVGCNFGDKDAAKFSRLNSRRELAKDGRRTRIVKAAYQLLREEVGAHELSMKMIADRAGVSPATVYNLFGTKAYVLEQVYEPDKVAFMKQVETAPSDSLDRIFDGMRISTEQYRADPRFYRSVMRMPDIDPSETQISDEVFRIRQAFWSELVAEAVRDGHLGQKPDAGQVGTLLTHMASSALNYWISCCNRTGADRARHPVGIRRPAAATTPRCDARPRLQARLEPASAMVVRRVSAPRPEAARRTGHGPVLCVWSRSVGAQLG